MRATLLLENAALTEKLRAAFVLAEIDLTVVSTVQELLRAAAAGREGDFLVIDCSLDRADDVERCRDVLSRTTLPVYIIHPRAAVVDELRSATQGELSWVSPDAIGLALLPRLLALHGREQPLGAVEGILRERRQPAQVYAVGSRSSGVKKAAWEGLRSMVRRVPGVELIGSAADPAQAAPVVRDIRPDVILVATDDGGSILEVTEQLQAKSPESRFVVIGDRPDEELELAFIEMGMSYVPWDDLDQEGMSCTMATAVTTELQVVSRPAVEEGEPQRERRRRPRVEAQVFSDKERAILHGLARGLTEEQIAEEQDISERTVRRRVRELKVKLEAETLSDLRRIARELGFGAGDTEE